ncbi:hypothetical protein CH63R_06891 [Colletotrichum higginsianum IMI 349063]|uniref:Uncharacterized protein n=1 Tax=Colletotrichum higginsianum (strain IMI 349063) TaxID=759273 RepID=A0A1B7YGK2_COLHI|nr:hypothetical protein CH63R_06891 [Colletotrichum higginsianum IMI 349063]OBR11199.1 hypothetical protein CH63R_06891 [Colletotrichum higginsianum IMI 349063]
MAWNAAAAATHPKAPEVVTRALKPASSPSAMRKFSRSLFPTGHMSRALGQPETKKLATKTVWFETLRRSNIRDGHGQQGLDRGYTEA